MESQAQQPLPPRSRATLVVVLACVTILGVLGVVATIRIAISGYRQGLTEARLRQIAVAVAAVEHGSGMRMKDIGALIDEGELTPEDFIDARTNHQQVDQLVGGEYRVGDFIFSPVDWSQDPDRAVILGWTDEIDGFRIMVLRDARTRSLKPGDWQKLLGAGIVPGG